MTPDRERALREAARLNGFSLIESVVRAAMGTQGVDILADALLAARAEGERRVSAEEVEGR